MAGRKKDDNGTGGGVNWGRETPCMFTKEEVREKKKKTKG